MRTPILAGNWKLNKTVSEALDLVQKIQEGVREIQNVEVVVGPPFTALYPVAQSLEGSSVQLAAQDVFWEDSGAYTGEVSAPMLRDVGCRYVIVAHSERRQYFGESNATANRKIRAVLAAGLRPIYCVGETLEQRQTGITQELIAIQIKEGLQGLSPEQMRQTVIAYEPVWAIGTGVTATPEQAQEVHAHIRTLLAERFDAETADSVRIQYGGSVKPENIAGLISQPDIDGALIGGASLTADSFLAIIQTSSELTG